MREILDYIKALLRDTQLRINLFSSIASLVNGAYIVFNLTLGMSYSEAWYVALAAYYLVLVISRYVSPTNDAAVVGRLILILSVPMCGMVLRTVETGAAHTFPDWLRVPLAVYLLFTLLRVILGTRAMFSSPSDFSRNAVSLCALLFSAFTFQASFLGGIGIDSRLAARLNFFTGIFVSVLTFFIGVYASRRRTEN